jgi:hypothetical protein
VQTVGSLIAPSELFGSTRLGQSVDTRDVDEDVTPNVKEQFSVFGRSGVLVFGLLTWLLLAVLFRGTAPKVEERQAPPGDKLGRRWPYLPDGSYFDAISAAGSPHVCQRSISTRTLTPL